MEIADLHSLAIEGMNDCLFWVVGGDNQSFVNGFQDADRHGIIIVVAPNSNGEHTDDSNLVATCRSDMAHDLQLGWGGLHHIIVAHDERTNVIGAGAWVQSFAICCAASNGKRVFSIFDRGELH